MGNDISLSVLFKSVCFDFFSNNVSSSVIGIRTSNGFNDITHSSHTLAAPTFFSHIGISGIKNSIELHHGYNVEYNTYVMPQDVVYIIYVFGKMSVDIITL